MNECTELILFNGRILTGFNFCQIAGKGIISFVKERWIEILTLTGQSEYTKDLHWVSCGLTFNYY